MDLDPRMIERAEEAKTLDMVHVKMGQQDVDPRQIRRQLSAEPANAGAGIQHQHGAVSGAHLDARGIAAVAGGFRSWCGDRATGAEERHAHQSPISQKRAAAPKNSPLRSAIGMAATSMCRRAPFSPWM
jgi:hypothetical protein